MRYAQIRAEDDFTKIPILVQKRKSTECAKIYALHVCNTIPMLARRTGRSTCYKQIISDAYDRRCATHKRALLLREHTLKFQYTHKLSCCDPLAREKTHTL